MTGKKMSKAEIALNDLLDCIEELGLIEEIEAGCDLNGDYAKACRAIKRTPKWPAGFTEDEIEARGED